MQLRNQTWAPASSRRDQMKPLVQGQLVKIRGCPHADCNTAEAQRRKERRHWRQGHKLQQPCQAPRRLAAVRRAPMLPARQPRPHALCVSPTKHREGKTKLKLSSRRRETKANREQRKMSSWQCRPRLGSEGESQSKKKSLQIKLLPLKLVKPMWDLYRRRLPIHAPFTLLQALAMRHCMEEMEPC